ncbi:MAG: hypothetical protein IT385_21105 [Deltaproteobacteria bacterium]|nr:hypothetical protein [Deltaproteobacteria bacterium]
MDREEAKAALQMLRKVVAQAKDDTALQNWGMVWMCSAVSNGGGFFATHLLLRAGDEDPWSYVGVWGVVFALNALFLVTLKGRGRGAASFIERQTWAIWNIFIVAMCLAAVVNYIIGLTTLFLPSVAAIIAMMTFAFMGAIMGRWWLLPAAAWGVLALVMAATPGVQFALFAVLWAATQGGAGYLLHRARRAARQRAAGASA